LAKAVLQHEGQPPPGLDITFLQAYAQARQVDVMEAARMIVNSMAASAHILAQTEQLKDQMLARIDDAKTLADVRAVAAELDAWERI
jgi:hypothetical protein